MKYYTPSLNNVLDEIKSYYSQIDLKNLLSRVGTEMFVVFFQLENSQNSKIIRIVYDRTIFKRKTNPILDAFFCVDYVTDVLTVLERLFR